MYRDDASTGIESKIANAHESAKDLQALLHAWNMESFNHTQTRQALKVIHRLEMSHRKGVEGLRKEQVRQVAKLRVQSISYPGTLNPSRKHSATHGYGGTLDDPWEVSQGLAGREAISCRRGLANRPRSNEELPVSVVAMPKVETGYSAREKLWRAFLAHRQLALGRGALACVAQLSEQSTFTLERRISTANLMIGEQGCVLRLGGIRWGPEIHGVGQATETALRERDTDLCLGLAETLEGLLGLGRAKDDDETGAEDNNPADSKELGSNTQDKMSLMLVNILSWLRLSAGSREGITLKGLLGHQYFTPLRHADIESEIPSAWKTFMDQGKDV
ncbi:unnamed protein product [Ectocarpus sp. 8 AP-2014]